MNEYKMSTRLENNHLKYLQSPHCPSGYTLSFDDANSYIFIHTFPFHGCTFVACDEGHFNKFDFVFITDELPRDVALGAVL